MIYKLIKLQTFSVEGCCESDTKAISSGHQGAPEKHVSTLGRGDDTVGNPHRSQIYQFELFELNCEQFEAAVSQSTVPSPLSLGTTGSGLDAGRNRRVHIKRRGTKRAI